jgi:hypothetical protein
VSQQKLIELLAARHAQRASDPARVKTIVDGLCKHIKQIVDDL